MGILDPSLEAYVPRFVQIESGGDPNARTGSYTGVLQMGPDEIAKYGGNGLEQGKALLADRAAELESKLGRPPTPTELYLAHQQGVGGATAHLANPDLPAWQNMYSTGEGQKKGEAWAKQAIWGNLTPAWKAQFTGPDDPNLTSRAFTNLWRGRVEGGAVANYNPTTTETPQQPQKPLPPQPLNLAQPMGSLGAQQMGQAPQEQMPAYDFSPQRPQPMQSKFNLAQAYQKIPLPPGFRGFRLG